MTGIISSPVAADNKIFIVIPAYDEESLIPVAKSLIQCEAPNETVEVLVIFNASELDNAEVKDKNTKAQALLEEWLQTVEVPSFISFHSHLDNDLPAKHAGVGLARKIGMDEGLLRFENINKEGVIVNLDADCTVASNYLVAIEKHFNENPSSPGASIFFEHPLSNLNSRNYNAIVYYELHLRYFINMQRVIDFPWAFQTIGSAMVVRSSFYKKQGGMNKRKAGEDFYFLQKIIELGDFTEINDTTVYASARTSHRVPFGTGKAVSDILDGKIWSLYNPKCFELLKHFFKTAQDLYGKDINEIEQAFSRSPKELYNYLKDFKWFGKIAECSLYTKEPKSFIKRFYRNFNAFQLMKFCHHFRDYYYPNVSYYEGISYLFKELSIPFHTDMKRNLEILRTHDRS